MKISVDPINRPIQFSYNFCIRKRKEYRRNSLRLRSVEVQSAKIRMCLRDDVLQAAGSQTPTRQITRIKHTSNFTISGFHTSLGEFMVCEPLVETSHTGWRFKVANKWPPNWRNTQFYKYCSLAANILLQSERKTTSATLTGSVTKLN